MEHVLGIDGGATKTLAVVCALDGRVLGRGEAGPSSHVEVGIAGAEQALRAAVERARQAAGVGGRARAVAAGLAGLDSTADGELLSALVARLDLAEQQVVVNDVVVALAGAVTERPAGIVAAGTGAVAAAESADGRFVRVDGWGPFLGDDGSGYALGHAALRHLARTLDGREPADLLAARLRAALGVQTPDDLLGLLAAGRWREAGAVAALAPLVAAAAADGDHAARQILAGAGEELARSLTAALWQIGALETPSLVSTTGGLWACGEPLRRPFLEALARLAPGARYVEPRLPPVLGAALLALRAAGVTPEPALLARLGA